MKIYQIRNATVVIEAAGQRILLDPMLGPVGSLPPYALIRFRASRNPLINPFFPRPPVRPPALSTAFTNPFFPRPPVRPPALSTAFAGKAIS
jgi:L-ascorbate metabolism protein UlaG (beta-lactamase superfamily)